MALSAPASGHARRPGVRKSGTQPCAGISPPQHRAGYCPPRVRIAARQAWNRAAESRRSRTCRLITASLTGSWSGLAMVSDTPEPSIKYPGVQMRLRKRAVAAVFAAIASFTALAPKPWPPPCPGSRPARPPQPSPDSTSALAGSGTVTMLCGTLATGRWPPQGSERAGVRGLCIPPDRSVTKDSTGTRCRPLRTPRARPARTARRPRPGPGLHHVAGTTNVPSS